MSIASRADAAEEHPTSRIRVRTTALTVALTVALTARAAPAHTSERFHRPAHRCLWSAIPSCEATMLLPRKNWAGNAV
jgi:hypothetical protein